MIFATGMGTIRQTVKAGRGNQECEMGKMKSGTGHWSIEA
jgi:hypothetical protein